VTQVRLVPGSEGVQGMGNKNSDAQKNQNAVIASNIAENPAQSTY
jgi:hypothetical protein